MNTTTQAIDNDLDQLTQDAKILMSDTAEMAQDKLTEARRHLACLLDRSKDMYAIAREKTLEGSKAADVAVHAHLYQAIGVGVGVGALIGYLCASRCKCSDESCR
jgi:ElaB/YqjD/DUF883 family membrane-anchored ribosome-binding protein